jgi:hypothetical protein
MTREELARSPDSDVEQAILDRIAAAIEADPGREGEIVRGLPLGAKMLHTTSWVEAEVSNGGFQQYFWNSTGEFANEAVAGFELLDAKEHAELMRRAIAIADVERPTREQYQAQDSVQAFSESYKHTRLGDLDDEFYKLPDLSTVRVRLIRERPELFAAK